VLSVLAALSLLAHPAVTVTPQCSWVDQPVAIHVSALPPRALATVRLTAKDATAKTWHSSVRFRANSHGAIVLTRRQSWTLLATLTRQAPIASPVLFQWGSRARVLRLSVQVRGKTVAHASFRRGLPQRVSERKLTLAGQGIYGEYYAAAGQATRAPAVLIFGGSEGGLTVGLRAELLAAHGFPTLAIAYFREPGLPETLAYVPLEYFRRALEWLAAQPQVDTQRMAVIGISRGGEAAQLLGVHYPNLVDAVVAASSSNTVVCGYPDCSKPAWTLGGEPIPNGGAEVPEPEGEHVIPDEQIRGPIFLVCGGADEIWLSCGYARATDTRLHRLGHPYPDELHVYPKAGHFVGGLMPGLPVAPRFPYFDAPTERARQDLWPKLLTFLGRL
jgi:dienelactone hydrolase